MHDNADDATMFSLVWTAAVPGLAESVGLNHRDELYDLDDDEARHVAAELSDKILRRLADRDPDAVRKARELLGGDRAEEFCDDLARRFGRRRQ